MSQLTMAEQTLEIAQHAVVPIGRGKDAVHEIATRQVEIIL